MIYQNEITGSVERREPALHAKTQSSRVQMKPISRLFVGLAALLLAATYFLPLWEISLNAPQYPEGLGMEIWINQIQGQHEGDLKKINNLNHYIGMKQIKPESIPELLIMPWIMRGVMLFGLLVALLGRRGMLLMWLFLFLLVSAAGFVDFYLWGYDYGHNLDFDKAIIKVPGMSYQPPLIGTKKLLNFEATSLPGMGGYILIVAVLIGTGVWGYEKRLRVLLKRAIVQTATIGTAVLVLMSGSIACSSYRPARISYGIDQCDYCKMTIVDKSFGAELVTTKGKIYKFDSIECLAAAALERDGKSESNYSLWVTNFHEPEVFLNVENAFVVAAERQRSPMGVGLVGVDSKEAATELIGHVGGVLLKWSEVKKHVAQAWRLPTAK